jgi:hypothetical protein
MSKPPKPPKTPKQLATSWGCGIELVLGHISSGDLEAINIAKGSSRPRWMITEEAEQAFLKSRSNQNAKPKRQRKNSKIRIPEIV